MKNKKVAVIIIASLLVVVLGLLATVLILEGDKTKRPDSTQNEPTAGETEYTEPPTERGPGEFFIPGENEGGMA